MKKTNVYEVAGHRFVITAEENLLQEMEGQYGPFIVKDANVDGMLFWLEMVDEDEFPSTEGMTEEIMQDEDFVKMLIGHIGMQSYFEFWLWGRCMGRMLVDKNRQKAMVTTTADAIYTLDTAAMLMYTLSTPQLDTVLFHSSVVEHQGRAYMFLGKSGTGKSTHSRLWLQYIQDTALVNDDNPIVRVDDKGQATVYGSPWSGKTSCYRNVNYPIGGIVKLDQAPKNIIRRLTGAEAYAAIVPSISGKRWDRIMADGLHETENALVMNVPIWHLDCRPNEEAAKVCYEAINID